jgi:diguanylate cyclase (GGDEF)-like protein
MAQDCLSLSGAVLDRFMPMHMVLSHAGEVLSHGATLSRVLPQQSLTGRYFHDLFEVRAPGSAVTIADILARSPHRFRLLVKGEQRIGLRGVAMVSGPVVIVNLSFGIDLVSAVRQFGLTDRDFAATDLAMELLYLAEVNATVTRELRGLTFRLDGARVAAEEEALTDRLTGLRNRRAADRVLARLCASSAPFALMQIDLDFFKAVNDTLGHAAGDYVLTHVAGVLGQQIREEDCAARVGGDEFLILLTGKTNPRHLQAIADRIIAHVSEPLSYEGQPCRISASIGIVRSVDYPTPDAAMMLADADAGLYAAKRAGRGRAVLIDHALIRGLRQGATASKSA